MNFGGDVGLKGWCMGRGNRMESDLGSFEISSWLMILQITMVKGSWQTIVVLRSCQWSKVKNWS